MPTNRPETNEPTVPGHVASTERLGLVERLRLIAAWNTPGGPEPSVKPDKMATCNEAADRVIDLTLEVQSLRAEVEALRADAERLDWIGLQALDELRRSLVIDAPHDGEFLVCGDGDSFGYGDTLRAAIDAARKA